MQATLWGVGGGRGVLARDGIVGVAAVDILLCEPPSNHRLMLGK
jgi:hypothetical protein